MVGHVATVDGERAVLQLGRRGKLGAVHMNVVLVGVRAGLLFLRAVAALGFVAMVVLWWVVGVMGEWRPLVVRDAIM